MAHTYRTTDIGIYGHATRSNRGSASLHSGLGPTRHIAYSIHTRAHPLFLYTKLTRTTESLVRHTQASIQHAAARSSHATPHTTQSRLCSERMSMQLRSTGPRIVRYGEGWVRSTCDSKERAGARGHGHCLTALYCGRSMLAVAGFVAFATQCSRSCRAKCSARVEGHVVQFG